MGEFPSKPDGTGPVVDSGRCCWKCGYNLTGLEEPVRCPECGEQWPKRPRTYEFGTRFSTLVWLNVGTAGVVVLMLLTPRGPDGGFFFFPPAGALVRLILFPVQWFLVRTTIRFAMKLNARKEEAISLYVWGLVIPVATAGLTLYFGGKILVFQGPFFWLFG